MELIKVGDTMVVNLKESNIMNPKEAAKFGVKIILRYVIFTLKSGKRARLFTSYFGKQLVVTTEGMETITGEKIHKDKDK